MYKRFDKLIYASGTRFIAVAAPPMWPSRGIPKWLLRKILKLAVSKVHVAPEG